MLCRYFGHLASVVEEATDFVPPTVNQIRLAYPQLTPGHLVASQQLQQLLLDLGIHQGTLDKVGFGVLQGGANPLLPCLMPGCGRSALLLDHECCN